MSIGEKLKSLRGSKSRAVVANALGIALSTLTMYENNNRVPRDEIKVRISKYYGMPIEELFFSPWGHEK